MIAPNTEFPTQTSTVVIALNNLSCRNLVSRFFFQQGWKVEEAHTHDSVHKLCTTRSPQLVVLDTEWPIESGWLRCKKLTSVLPELPIFLLSPKASAKETAQAGEVGAIAVASYAMLSVQLQDSIEEMNLVEA